MCLPKRPAAIYSVGFGKLCPIRYGSRGSLFRNEGSGTPCSTIAASRTSRTTRRRSDECHTLNYLRRRRSCSPMSPWGRPARKAVPQIPSVARCLACHASPSHTTPRRAVPRLPCPAKPRQAGPCLAWPCPTGPRLPSPDHACPASPAKPCLPCLIQPSPALVSSRISAWLHVFDQGFRQELVELAVVSQFEIWHH